MDTQPSIDPLVLIAVLILLAAIVAFSVNFAEAWSQITPSQEQMYGSHLQATLSIIGQNFHNFVHHVRGSH